VFGCPDRKGEEGEEGGGGEGVGGRIQELK